MFLSANMKTQVSLVGRTNVGKSLLFNKLVKSRKSLVVDFDGSTRDINHGIISHKDKSIVIEDEISISNIDSYRVYEAINLKNS